MAVFDPRHGKPALPHAGTFSANPVTMRAGLAAMQLLDDAAFTHLDAMGDGPRRRQRCVPAKRCAWRRGRTWLAAEDPFRPPADPRLSLGLHDRERRPSDRPSLVSGCSIAMF